MPPLRWPRAPAPPQPTHRLLLRLRRRSLLRDRLSRLLLRERPITERGGLACPWCSSLGVVADVWWVACDGTQKKRARWPTLVRAPPVPTLLSPPTRSRSHVATTTQQQQPR